MYFFILIGINVLALLVLILFSFLPFLPPFTRTRLNLHRWSRISICLLFALLLTVNVILGLRLSQTEKENARLTNVEQYAAAAAGRDLDWSRIIDLLPEADETEMEVATFRNTADLAYASALALDSLDSLYWDTFPQGQKAPFDKGENRENLRALLVNIANALQKIADRRGGDRTFTPDMGEKRLIKAVRSIAQTLREKKSETLQKIPAGLPFYWADYELSQTLLQSDPQIRELYKTIAQYGK